MDETGLNWKSLPRSTYISSIRNGSKSDKSRYTILLFATAAGKIHRLTIIGKRAQPICSRGLGAPAWKEMTENVFYASQDNAWMSTAIFEEVILKYGMLPITKEVVRCFNKNLFIRRNRRGTNPRFT